MASKDETKAGDVGTWRLVVATVTVLTFILAWTSRPDAVLGETPTAEADDSEAIYHLVQQATPGLLVQPPQPPVVEPPVGEPIDRAPAESSRGLTTPRRRTPSSGTPTRPTPVLLLASVPNMLGDFYGQQGQFTTTGGNFDAVADLPAAGGGRMKIAENNKALPMDRCYVMYHHFHNALTADSNLLIPGTEEDADVNRYTIGIERMFFEGNWSVDLRMPFFDTYNMQSGAFGVQGGEIGNLSVALKRLISATEMGAVAAGLGINVPTGSDVHTQDSPNEFTLNNQTVRLSPYLGFLRTPNPCTFIHGFAQIDLPLNGNRVDYVDTGSGQSGSLGLVTEQTLLYLDVAAGYWLYRNPCSCGVTGVASLLELHYATTLQDADVVTGTLGGSTVEFGNVLNRLDFTNVTVGVHTEFGGRNTFRVAGVFPLQDELRRPFDAELQITFNKYY